MRNDRKSELWSMIFSSSVARQAHDLIDRGGNPDDDAHMDKIIRVAFQVADLAEEAVSRLTTDTKERMRVGNVL